jgi:hypothetical protein
MKSLPKKRDHLAIKIREVFGSQTAFAFVLEENNAFVSMVINGWKTPDNAKQLRWARALGCKPEEIFPGDHA